MSTTKTLLDLDQETQKIYKDQAKELVQGLFYETSDLMGSTGMDDACSSDLIILEVAMKLCEFDNRTRQDQALENSDKRCDNCEHWDRWDHSRVNGKIVPAFEGDCRQRSPCVGIDGECAGCTLFPPMPETGRCGDHKKVDDNGTS